MLESIGPSSSISKVDLPKITIPKAFHNTVQKYGNKIALRSLMTQNEKSVESSQNVANHFSEIVYTWQEYYQASRSFAKALLAKELTLGRSVTIQGPNSLQWQIAFMGTVMSGGVAAGIYSTNGPEATQHVVTNSQAEVVVVDNEDQLKKYAGLQSTAVKCFVVWNNFKNSQLQSQLNLPAEVCSWEDFIAQGKDISEESLQQRIQQQTPDRPCSLIYTSGTTGMPKGAVLSHDNLVWTASVTAREFSIQQKDRCLSYLPLSHIAASQLDVIAPMLIGSEVNIAPADALKEDNLKRYIVHARPTYFLGVPRVWEKFQEGIKKSVSLAPMHKKLMFNAATALGRRIARDLHPSNVGKSPVCPKLNAIKQRIESFVLAKLNDKIFTAVKSKMGLDHCRIAASGAAPISSDVVDFFTGLNIQILNLYGMSETSGPIALSSNTSVPRQSCGKALPGTELILAEVDDNGIGEIRTKGRHIFQEYINNKQATQAVFDDRQFLRTGDAGRFDKDGNLFITGRIKELIKTSGGENIPPVKIEEKITQELPIVSQAVVIGDGKKFLTGLVTLKTRPDSEGNATNELTQEVVAQLKQIGSNAETVTEAQNDQILHSFLMEGIQRVNYTADSNAHRIQKITILPEDFSVSNGMLTPTLKLRRSIISARYASQIDKMYLI